VTPPEAVEPAVLAAVEEWNRSIPKNRCLILDQRRFDEIRYCLELLRPDELLLAIRFYARQAWNRRTGAWKRFDNWFQADVARQWFETAVEAAQAARIRNDRAAPVDPRVRKLAAELARRRDADPEAQEKAAFDALPETQRVRLLEAGRAELTARGWKVLTDFAVGRQAIAIWRREAHGSAAKTA